MKPQQYVKYQTCYSLYLHNTVYKLKKMIFVMWFQVSTSLNDLPWHILYSAQVILVTDCLSCEERRRSKLINLIYVFYISKGKILLFYFSILLYLLKNEKSGRNLSKKYRYEGYLHGKKIVAVQVNKTHKR